MGNENTKKLKSYNRIIIDKFLEKKAINENNSINYDDINVEISDGEKHFLIKSFMQDGFIKMKNDSSMWFDKSKWDKAVNKISNIYLLILFGPLVVMGLIFLILNRYG